MNWTNLHLALNHLPVVGVPMLLLFLAIGYWRRSEEVQRLSLWLIAAMAVLAIAMKFTGDFAAEEAATRLAPVQSLVTAHEETGDQATTAVFVWGLVALATLFAARKQRPVPKWGALFTLVLGLASAALYARAAHAGGQISHPELRDSPPAEQR